jgi:predicted TIM-barrel fold metal-dependent hydrolase
MEKLPFVDAHHHLWNIEKHYYPWLADKAGTWWFGDYASIRRNYLVEDYRRDTRNQNVVKSVHLQAMWNPKDPAGESRWLQDCFDATGFPTGIVGFANPADPDVETVLKAHRQYPNVKGIRMDINWHPDPLYSFCDRPDYASDPQWLKGFALIEKYGFSFDLQIYVGVQGEEARRLVKSFPGTPFILDHVGLPWDRTEAGMARWRDALHGLADLPNVAVKLSGFGMFDKNWTVDSIAPFVREPIRIFGVDRCLFASNFPVESLYGSYDRTIDAYRQIVADLPIEDQRKLFHDNAVRYYRL